MECFLHAPDWDVWAVSLNRPFRFHSPFSGDEFALLLVVNDPGLTPDECFDLSKRFVLQGCRYAVCTGHDSPAWDDSIDLASVMSKMDGDLPEDRLVMTTWHEDEPMEDVARWFRENTAFDDFIPRHFLVIFVGENPPIEAEIKGVLARIFEPQSGRRPLG